MSSVDKRSLGPEGLKFGEMEMMVERMEKEETSLDDPWHQQLYSEREEMLVTWRAELAQREVGGHQPSDEEMKWIKLISRYYLAYVPFQRRRLHKTQDPNAKDTNIFVSHAGTEKLSYAMPLKNYLDRCGVEDVFLDKESLSAGQRAVDEMWRAAMSCNHFWCVLTKSYITRKWPMREFLIASARYSSEDNNRFRLILDCLEPSEERPSGEWREWIVKRDSLMPHDKFGIISKLPTADPARAEESFDQRIERLAPVLWKTSAASSVSVSSKSRASLSRGSSFRLPSISLSSRSSQSSRKYEFEDMPESEYHHMHSNGFPHRKCVEIFRGAQKIRLLNSWIANLSKLRVPLIEAGKAGAEIKFLLFDPKSPLPNLRELALQGESLNPKGVHTNIQDNLALIRRIEKDISRDGCTPNVQVRVYKSLNSFALWQADEVTFATFHYTENVGITMPTFEVRNETRFGKSLWDEFDLVWERSEQYSEPTAKSNEPTPTT